MPSRLEPGTPRPSAPRAERRRWRPRPLVAGLALGLLVLVPTTGAAEGDTAYRAAVTRLLELQKTPESVSQQLTYSIAQQTLGSISASGIAITEPVQRVVFEVSKSTFGDRFEDPSVLADLYVPIYSEVYSRQELDQLIAFWESPLGRKTIERMPEMTQQSFAVLEKASAPYIEEYQRNLDERFAAEGIALVPEGALAPTSETPSGAPTAP